MESTIFSQWFESPIAIALARAFIHSLWIGLIVALLAAGAILITKKSSPKSRHNFFLGLSALFVVLVTIAFVKEYTSLKNDVLPLYSNIDFSSTLSADQLITTSWIQKSYDLLLLYSPVIIQCWLIFFIIRMIGLISGLVTVNRLSSNKTSLPDITWLKRLEEYKKHLNINIHVQLLQSEIVKVPAAIGFLKPVILIPAGLLTSLPPAHIEAILLHELAHIRRQDYLINLIQHFFEAIFFFNPAFTWLSSLIRQEREACCDDMVVSTTSRQHEYVHALVAFQEFSHYRTELSLGFSNKKRFLFNRVKRLLTRENKQLNWMEIGGLMAGLILFCAFTLSNHKKENSVNGNIPSSFLMPGDMVKELYADTIPARVKSPERRSKKSTDSLHTRRVSKNDIKSIESVSTRKESRILHSEKTELRTLNVIETRKGTFLLHHDSVKLQPIQSERKSNFINRKTVPRKTEPLKSLKAKDPTQEFIRKPDRSGDKKLTAKPADEQLKRKLFESSESRLFKGKESKVLHSKPSVIGSKLKASQSLSPKVQSPDPPSKPPAKEAPPAKAPPPKKSAPGQ